MVRAMVMGVLSKSACRIAHTLLSEPNDSGKTAARTFQNERNIKRLKDKPESS
jgi:hypothetical protein